MPWIISRCPRNSFNGHCFDQTSSWWLTVRQEKIKLSRLLDSIISQVGKEESKTEKIIFLSIKWKILQQTRWSFTIEPRLDWSSDRSLSRKTNVTNELFTSIIPTTFSFTQSRIRKGSVNANMEKGEQNMAVWIVSSLVTIKVSKLINYRVHGCPMGLQG